ncbi:MAG: hypothetical protein H0W02_11590 [Ktedonobacteraceae bacterium]|nr:hypothetical protein [Ktedonobacteraceae bacterium]
MKMNSQFRTFAKQVQVDLLALNDADLFRTIHQWVGGENASGASLNVAEDTLLVLGYTREGSETEALLHPQDNAPADEDARPSQWQAPSPHHLRTLLTTMDVNLFAQHVITLAFQSLHTIYPEWYEGVTFSAHLANYLRQLSTESAKYDESVVHRRMGKYL